MKNQTCQSQKAKTRTCYFQHEPEHFQFAQLDAKFDPRIEALLKQSEKDHPRDLDLRRVWLLDSQSTTNLFCNKRYVTDIKECDTAMRLQSNGGQMATRKKGRVPGYDTRVWFSTRAITNVIALKDVIKQYRVTYDSNDQYFVVHRGTEGKPNMLFKMHPSGLHYFDPDNEECMFVNTVTENMQDFTKRQIQRAEVARALYRKLGFPSTKDFKWVVMSNQIRDCPVTVSDIEVATKIWGKDIAMLKGKTVKKKPLPVVKDIVKVPKEFIKLHRNVTLGVDIFFLNKIPFFISLSRVIYFTTSKHLPDRKIESIFQAFKEVHAYYLHRGFRIEIVLADGEFEPLRPLIEAIPFGPRLNVSAKSEHVAEIERRIRVVKERTRAMRHAMPFTKIPKLLTIHTVLQGTRLLNYFPSKGGVSASISSMSIMSGEILNYKKHLSLQVGQYCQVHEEESPRNSQHPRTKGAIVLGPSGNVQGGYRFMALNTGQKITRYSWTEVPMPDTVIARVNQLGADQPEHLTFTDRHGNLIGDNETPGVVPEYPPEEEDPDDPIEIPGVADDVGIPGVDVGTQDPQAIDIDPNTTVQDDPPPIEPEDTSSEPNFPTQSAAGSSAVKTRSTTVYDVRFFSPSRTATRSNGSTRARSEKVHESKDQAKFVRPKHVGNEVRLRSSPSGTRCVAPRCTHVHARRLLPGGT